MEHSGISFHSLPYLYSRNLCLSFPVQFLSRQHGMLSQRECHSYQFACFRVKVKGSKFNWFPSSKKGRTRKMELCEKSLVFPCMLFGCVQNSKNLISSQTSMLGSCLLFTASVWPWIQHITECTKESVVLFCHLCSGLGPLMLFQLTSQLLRQWEPVSSSCNFLLSILHSHDATKGIH